MKKWICGNWKMNGDQIEVLNWSKEAQRSAKEYENVEVGIAPPFIYLQSIIKYFEEKNVKIGAQNAHWENKGAFTGEISPISLKNIGCDFVILGHSERRNIFSESDGMISKRLISSLNAHLNAILCVGERLEERERNKTFDVIRYQIENSMEGIETDNLEKLTLAYEPVWAIGTGKVAKPEQAQEVHEFIRRIIRDKYGEFSKNIRILYGGSVKPENWHSLDQMPDIDGALVGGASLVPEIFRKIIEISNKGE